MQNSTFDMRTYGGAESRSDHGLVIAKLQQNLNITRNK